MSITVNNDDSTFIFLIFISKFFLAFSFYQRPSAPIPNIDRKQNIIRIWTFHIFWYTIYNQFNKKGRRTFFLLFQSSSMENDKRKSILFSLILRIFSLKPSIIIPTHMNNLYTCINVGLRVLRLLNSLLWYENVHRVMTVEFFHIFYLPQSYSIYAHILRNTLTAQTWYRNSEKCDQMKKNLFFCEAKCIAISSKTFL